MAPPMCIKEAERKVRSWGFRNVFTWTDSPKAYYPPHDHPDLTTHLILSGTFIVAYPENPELEKTVYRAGARVDIDAGKVHEVWMGEEGCTYVIGE